MATISDEEYNKLMVASHTAAFAESIWNDPALSKEAKRLAKRKYPNLEIPELDIRDEVDARFNAEKKAREDAEAATKQAAEDEAWKKERAEIQQQYGFTDDGMKELEEFMVKNNVGSYEVAASYKASKQPKPSDATYGGDHFWNHRQQEGFAEVAKDPEGWARTQILQAIRNDERREREQR